MKKLTLIILLLATIIVANAQTSFKQSEIFSNVGVMKLSYYSDTTFINLNGLNTIIIEGSGIQIIGEELSFMTMDDNTTLKIKGSFLVIPNKKDKKQYIKIIYNGNE